MDNGDVSGSTTLLSCTYISTDKKTSIKNRCHSPSVDQEEVDSGEMGEEQRVAILKDSSDTLKGFLYVDVCILENIFYNRSIKSAAFCALQ